MPPRPIHSSPISVNEDKSISIVANGEIYNSKQIRQHLEQDPSVIEGQQTTGETNESANNTLSIPPHSSRHIFSTSSDTESILRKAFEDMLPEEIVWRRKEQFDEGSGTAGIMPHLAEQALSDGEYRRHVARNAQLALRSKEEAYYHRLFDQVYTNAQSVLQTVGRWSERPDWI